MSALLFPENSELLLLNSVHFAVFIYSCLELVFCAGLSKEMAREL
jgi:hypothetical protein